MLKGYSKEIFRSKCNSGAQTIHCFAHLDNDVTEVLPYLNSVLGGLTYTKNPPSVTFRAHGKLITIHPRKIAVNALKDEVEAEKIISWLQKEICDVWTKREEIEPSYESVSRPLLLEILKLLPKINCKECHEPTCMVFAARVAEGVKDHNDCPSLGAENRNKLLQYLSKFHFDQ